MKWTIIIILVLIVIGTSFYFGYLKSQNKKGIELRTTETNQPFHLEYKRDPTTSPGYMTSGTNSTLNINGTLHLNTLIENLFLNGKSDSWNSYYVELNPEVGKRIYQINLSIPKNEPALNIIESLGKQMGFTTQVSETTMQFYRAGKNDKPILFPKSTSNYTGCGYSSNHLCRFKRYDFDYIFREYKSNGVFIEDATGITDTFDGEVLLDQNNPDAMKAELQTKAGIDLIPFEKTIKLIQVY